MLTQRDEGEVMSETNQQPGSQARAQAPPDRPRGERHQQALGRMEKTVVVEVVTRYRDPVYGKYGRTGSASRLTTRTTSSERRRSHRDPGEPLLFPHQALGRRASCSNVLRRSSSVIQMRNHPGRRRQLAAPRRVQCIKVLGGSRRRYAGLGDVIVVAVQGGASERQGEEGRSGQGRRRSHVPREYQRPDGSYIKFDKNSAVLINAQNEPIGTRIFGPVARELRGKKFMKIISLAPEVV